MNCRGSGPYHRCVKCFIFGREESGHQEILLGDIREAKLARILRTKIVSMGGLTVQEDEGRCKNTATSGTVCEPLNLGTHTRYSALDKEEQVKD